MNRNAYLSEDKLDVLDWRKHLEGKGYKGEYIDKAAEIIIELLNKHDRKRSLMFQGLEVYGTDFTERMNVRCDLTEAHWHLTEIVKNNEEGTVEPDPIWEEAFARRLLKIPPLALKGGKKD